MEERVWRRSLWFAKLSGFVVMALCLPLPLVAYLLLSGQPAMVHVPDWGIWLVVLGGTVAAPASYFVFRWIQSGSKQFSPEEIHSDWMTLGAAQRPVTTGDGTPASVPLSQKNCPRCLSSSVTPGVTPEVIFIPKGLQKWNLRYSTGVSAISRDFLACRDCGLIWGEIGLAQLKKFLNRHGTKETKASIEL